MEKHREKAAAVSLDEFPRECYSQHEKTEGSTVTVKLKDSFMTQQIEDTQFLVSMGGEDFRGIVRSNKTAAFIVDMLARETDKEAIVEAMCRRYDAPRDLIAADVEEILNTLRSIHALEE